MAKSATSLAEGTTLHFAGRVLPLDVSSCSSKSIRSLAERDPADPCPAEEAGLTGRSLLAERSVALVLLA